MYLLAEGTFIVQRLVEILKNIYKKKEIRMWFGEHQASSTKEVAAASIGKSNNSLSLYMLMLCAFCVFCLSFFFKEENKIGKTIGSGDR